MTVDGEKVSDMAAVVQASDFDKGQVMLKKGKKAFHKVTRS